jgi:PAT family beta-lactamase induction signal transducer AmpG
LPAIFGADWRLFSLVMFCDNFGVGIAGVALVAYMSSLTKAGYTATQYG